ncbi:hypothetical protein RJ55_04750 [Drechmeria coniospora]|nr:hypothetical protein RJ55_04750 [Drechmeria coniospora]
MPRAPRRDRREKGRHGLAIVGGTVVTTAVVVIGSSIIIWHEAPKYMVPVRGCGSHAQLGACRPISDHHIDFRRPAGMRAKAEFEATSARERSVQSHGDGRHEVLIWRAPRSVMGSFDG